MKNWTPQALRCGFGSCPTVRELADGRLLIVGRAAHWDVAATEIAPMADDETAVIIDRALLGDIIREAVQAERDRFKRVLTAEYSGELVADIIATVIDDEEGKT